MNAEKQCKGIYIKCLLAPYKDPFLASTSII